MKRLVTTLLVLVLVVYGGYKGAVWWFADRALADVRQAVEAHGVIARGDIGSSVVGQLTLTGGHYQDFRLTQPLRVGHAVFDAGSPVALLEALIDPGRLPGQWTLSVEGLALALDAAMFRNWVTAGEEQAPNLFAPVCGPDHRQQLGSGDLMRLGVSELTGELLMVQDADRLYLEVSTAGTGSIEFDWPRARFNFLAPADTLVSSPEPMIVTLRDSGLMRRVAAYCARESGLGDSEWTSIVMEAFRNGLNARGFDASRQLLALYRQWLTEGGELLLELHPDRPAWGIPIQEIENLDQEAQPELAVSYNGARVPDVYLVRMEPELPRVPQQALEPVVPSGPGAALAGWRITDIGDAGRWVGQTVKVTLNSGRVVEGRLVNVDDRRLEVARMMDGGEVTYPMAIRAVSRFDVWRRGRAE